MIKKILIISFIILLVNSINFFGNFNTTNKVSLKCIIKNIFLPDVYASDMNPLVCDWVGCPGGEVICAFVNEGPDPDNVIACYDLLFV
ncbi:hypothetical protein Calab_1692 [Caldithrix abyssi DSM 13497]|uniref:Uncharacterized protein n=1 Tax=Caldithrix abyssi DSM 13497 TaxID=880073 RepID=H1XRV0_CALAY|nr:hypothetical protein [Caldithrix abyssi]EHO41310.1 hypothetical protein Calab_1692 [Caldithrix abyssi DSM 13497]